MIHYTYRIDNLINGKYYIGKHSSESLDDKYMGSGPLIKAAIAKYGMTNFKKTILKTFSTSEEAFEHEAQIVTMAEVNDPMCYNIQPGGKGGQKRFTDEELKERALERQKKYNQRPEVKERQKEYLQRPEAKERRKEYRQQNKEHISKQWKDYYQRNKESRKEYRQQNKERILEYHKEHYQQNKEQYRECMKEYYQQNKEQYRERMKEYRQQNKERILEQRKEYYQQNKERISKRQKEYYQRPEVKEQQKEYHRKRREQKKKMKPNESK